MTNPIMDFLKIKDVKNNVTPITSVDDPRLDIAKEYVNSHGGDPKIAFYALCKERGIDPEPYVKMVFGNK